MEILRFSMPRARGRVTMFGWVTMSGSGWKCNKKKENTCTQGKLQNLMMIPHQNQERVQKMMKEHKQL
jgi:hypothetical protein